MLNAPEQALVNLLSAATPLNGVAVPPPRVDPPLWPQIAEAAERHGLASLLYPALKALGPRSQPPDDVIETLRGLYMRIRANNWWAQQELGQWLDCFAQEHIPVVLLKGCVLTPTLYAGVGLRPIGDLDVLIPRAHVARVCGLLAERGYRPLTVELRNGYDVRFRSEMAFWREGKHPSQMDIHWHLFNIPYYATRIPIEWFWTRTTSVIVNGHAAQMFTPEAQLLHLSVHFSMHRWQRLVLSYDLALLLARHAEHIQWDEVVAAITSFGIVQIFQKSLAHAQECWGVAIPAGVVERIQNLHPDRAERLVSAAIQAKRTEALFFLQGLTTPGLKAKLQFWGSYALPSADYIHVYYHVPRRWIPLYYIWRIVKIPFRIARSLVTMLRKR